MHHGIVTHDSINTVALLDEDLVEHLEFFQKNNFLNNTLLIFMSDHGHRFVQFRETQQGQMEERMPFFSFSAPEWFRKQHANAWENLKANAERLTTPFDIYSTMKAIIDWHNPTTADLKSRSVSLWNKIPVERNCVHAEVEAHWCVCLNWRNVSRDGPIAKILSNALVQAINQELKPEIKLCSPLQVSLIDATHSLHDHWREGKNNAVSYNQDFMNNPRQ